MEDIQRFRAKRRGLKSGVTKLLAKIDGAISSRLEDVHSEVVSESQRLSVSTAITQLEAKRGQITELDANIAAAIQTEDELETEICDALTYHSTLEERIAFLTEFVRKANRPPIAADDHLPTLESVTDDEEESDPREPSPDPIVTDHAARASDTSRSHGDRETYHNYSRLPKLVLPTFSGESLQWQTFWDSFEAAVHSNPHLTGVQKFNYLRAQLHRDAAQAISGFPLTDSNYAHSIAILKGRFGQQYKLVGAHMEALLNVQAPANNLTGLQAFYDTIQSHMRVLSSLGKPTESYGSLLISVILNKIPKDIKVHMARDHHDTEWVIDELLASILKEIKILEAGQPSNRKSNSHTNPVLTTSSFYVASNRSAPQITEKLKKDPVCVFCKGAHKSNTCTTITSPKERLAIVKSAGLCYNCLARHRVSQCNSKFNCRECHKKHHTSLCHAFNTNTVPPLERTPPDQTLTTLTSTPLPVPYTSVCLLKTAIADISADSTTIEGHILFDEGAQRSFITQELADQLQLKPTGFENISVASVGAQVSTTRRLAIASIHIHTLNEGQIPVTVLVVPKLAAPIRNSVRTHLNKLSYLRGLPLAHPVTSDENFQISILIGADFYWQFVQDRVVRGDGPVAVESKLGYLLSGPLPLPVTATSTSFHVSILSCTTENTHHNSFWQVESTGTNPVAQNPDAKFLQQYMDTHITLQPDGAYSLKFPWKDNHPLLPSNYAVCARHTRSMAYRLAKTSKLLQVYGAIIDEQERRGFIERVDCSKQHGSVHYIPHHPVRKESSTTPIRIVYDCSCKQSPNSPSLNDCLDPGPPFLNDLCAILLRFRQYNFAFSSDIEKAFLHVHLDETDRDFTRFLWLSNLSDASSSFITFRFKVVLFGATCSPFMLNAALNYHLTKNRSDISQDILRNLYVDNLVSGCHTEGTAIKYFTKSRSLLRSATFNLRSWASNSHCLMNTAVEHQVADTNNPIKVLGLWWDVQQDLLIALPKSDTTAYANAVTKREILKWIASIFDPLGLITPVTISAKLFLQQLWQKELGWDAELSADLCKTWEEISNNVIQAAEMCFPRQCVKILPTPDTILHIFADASPKAYGAAAYFQQGSISSLTMSKSRAAPLKTLSMPKLELMAAVLAARLCVFITTSLNINCSVQLWTDSQIVLYWITSKRKLKPFVANRVSEIQSVSTSWRYCPSTDNPADLLTRGLTYNQLHSSVQWKHGPVWLISPSQWPTWQQSETLHINTEAACELEIVQENVATEHSTTGIHQLIDINTFSNLNKLLAVTAYVLRFIYNIRQPTLLRKLGTLTPSNLTQANLKRIHQVQHTVFSEEIANLKSSQNRLPLVRQLRLFLDCDQLLRCGGRIHNAPLSESAKFPYLLPSRHHLTVLIIQQAHAVQLHSGVNATLTMLRQQYWIPSARQRIKSIIHKCVVCKKTSGKPYSKPDPPPLVKSRVNQTYPFVVTGVDFTGALYVRATEGERKVYLCLFTCVASRAIHLEIVTNLTVESFLQAFRRFAGRRSFPKLLLSDNASTYLAAAEELKYLFSSTDLSESLSRKGTEWKFIPKRAPWFGGFWERLIGLTKSTLKKILGRTHATLESLQTIVVEVEGLLNDRPLTYVSSDLDDLEPITPSHLLYGRRIIPLPHCTVEDEEINDPNFQGVSELRQRARGQAMVIKHFWSRWKNEYLTALRESHKTTGNNAQQIKIGDVVLVHDDTARVNWRLAVIESLNKGEDGLVRSANIRTTTGRTNRPIARLYPLEVTAADQSTDEITTDDQNQMTDNNTTQPVRRAAERSRTRVKEWVTTLSGPPEDVINSNLT